MQQTGKTMKAFTVDIIVELTISLVHISEEPDHAKAKEFMAAAAGAFIDKM